MATAYRAKLKNKGILTQGVSKLMQYRKKFPKNM